MLALGLVARSQKPVEQGKIDALADVEDRLTREIDRIVKTRKFTETIRKNADKVDDQLRICSNQLDKLLGSSKSVLRALGVDAVAADFCEEESISFDSEIIERESLDNNIGGDSSIASVEEVTPQLNNKEAPVASNEARPDNGTHQGLSGLAGRRK